MLGIWIAAQEEFLSVRRMQGTDLAPLVDGARQRMRQVGMSDAQMRLVESSGRTQPRLTLTAPIGGVVTELLARDGMTMMAGATLFRINGLSTVWANAEVPERQAALVRPAAKVQAKSPAVPGATFDGKVQAACKVFSVSLTAAIVLSAFLPERMTITPPVASPSPFSSPMPRRISGPIWMRATSPRRTDTPAAFVINGILRKSSSPCR